MKNDLRYFGRVTPQGDIRLPKHVGAEVRGAFAGKDIEVIFRRVKSRRTSPQNRYYRGGIIPAVVQGFRDAGNDVNPNNPDDCELIHQYLKKRFLPPRQIVDKNGEVHNLPPSTADLSKIEFMDYIAQIAQFSAEYLNTIIPEPGEQSTLNL